MQVSKTVTLSEKELMKIIANALIAKNLITLRDLERHPLKMKLFNGDQEEKVLFTHAEIHALIG